MHEYILHSVIEALLGYFGKPTVLDRSVGEECVKQL